MKPTDDERREAARVLRESAHEKEWLRVAMCRILSCVDGWQGGYAIIADFLADLIEPQERTCHNEATGNFFHCSECGTHFGFVIPRGPRKAKTMRFCPSCGARITEVDDGE
jgi:DNA-directed RNA polymerase subunit RPC12/RpoP